MLPEKLSILKRKLQGPFHVLPDFIIIGAGRSGTTALYRYLEEHPNIAERRYKEINYFGRRFHYGLNWYRPFFPSKIRKFFTEKFNNKKLICGEATQVYLMYPYAAKHVNQIIPSTKFIVILRNPIDRAFSQHSWRHSVNKREDLTFEEAIEAEPKRNNVEWKKMIDDENYYSLYFMSYAYLERGKYAEQLERWFEVFPRKQFLIIQSEKFFEDPAPIMDKVYDFLSIPNHKLSNYKKINSQSYTYDMNPETRKKLSKYYAPHNEKLFKLLGERFNWD